MRFVFFVLMVGCVGGDEAKESGDSGAGEPEDLGVDVLQTECGPVDNLVPELEIGLVGEGCDATAPEDAVWVRIRFGELEAEVAGGNTYDVASDDLSVWIHTAGRAEYESPVSGTVTVDTYTREVEATGSYALVRTDGTTLSGSFDAQFCYQEFAECG